MKKQKLTKKQTGNFMQDEGEVKKPAGKLSQSKRAKKPSIYDELDDIEDFGDFTTNESILDYYDDDDDDDYY